MAWITELLFTALSRLQVSSALNDSASQACRICKIKISKMNDIPAILKRPIDEKSLQFGLPILHAYIRFLEVVLHISYKMSLKMWRVS